jgi:hypothetical protein
MKKLLTWSSPICIAPTKCLTITYILLSKRKSWRLKSHAERMQSTEVKLIEKILFFLSISLQLFVKVQNQKQQGSFSILLQTILLNSLFLPLQLCLLLKNYLKPLNWWKEKILIFKSLKWILKNSKLVVSIVALKAKSSSHILESKTEMN